MIDSQALGKDEIIRLMQKRLTLMPDMPVPFGDDVFGAPLAGGEVAVLKPSMLVGSTDIPAEMSLFAAARKAIVMGVNDFASKGVLPSAASATLGLPGRVRIKESVLEIADGLNAGAREYGCYVIGGDSGETADLVICVFLFGVARQGSLMLRRGTRAGDVLAVTGLFGKSAAGLRVLLGDAKASKRIRSSLVDSVLMPKAKLREGLALRGRDYVSASIDGSEGLARCLHELSRINEIGFLIDKVPAAVEAQEFAAENSLDPVDLALYGEEEYELVLTVNPLKWTEAKAMVQAVGGCLIPIGHATYEKQIIYEVPGDKRVVENRRHRNFNR